MPRDLKPELERIIESLRKAQLDADQARWADSSTSWQQSLDRADDARRLLWTAISYAICRLEALALQSPDNPQGDSNS